MRKYKITLNLSSLILYVFLSILLTSCEQNDLTTNDDAFNEELANAIVQTEIDEVSEGLDDIIENTSIDLTNNIAQKNTGTKTNTEQKFFSECVTITRVITDHHKKITLDYGEGCITRNENLLSGKILMEIYFDVKEKTIQVACTFDDFYLNDKKIEGEVHKIKLRVNEKGYPEATIQRNIKIIWDDGSFVTVHGERKREWVEGFGNKLWGDNVFLITGSQTITKKDGTDRTATIVTPLKRVMACRFLVSGIIEIEKNDKIIILNYGDGTCDDVATATIDGQEKEIQLTKRRRK